MGQRMVLISSITSPILTWGTANRLYLIANQCFIKAGRAAEIRFREGLVFDTVHLFLHASMAHQVGKFVCDLRRDEPGGIASLWSEMRGDFFVMVRRQKPVFCSCFVFAYCSPFADSIIGVAGKSMENGRQSCQEELRRKIDLSISLQAKYKDGRSV
jgi:hypothetical protein